MPLAGNKPAVGFDINSEPVRRDAIVRARVSNNMAVTSPVRLVQEKKERVGVLELMPVEAQQDTGAGEGQRPPILGFAVSVINLKTAIHSRKGAKTQRKSIYYKL